MLAYGYRWNPKILLTFPLYVWVICLIIIPLIHLAILEPTTVKTVVTLVPVAIIGFTISFQQSSLYAVAGKIGDYCQQGVVIGAGIAGLIPQAILIIIKLIVTLTNLQANNEEYRRSLFY